MKNETDLLAFEVVGNSMDNGTRSSFEEGDKLVVRPFDINDFRNAIGNDLNTFWIIEINQSTLFKQIIEYDSKYDMIKCHSLNTNGQYPDAFIKVEDITKVYRVVQVQYKPIHYEEL